MNILLICGSGASTGFMAASMRKAATEQGLTLTVTARSEAELENYADSADIIALGPHLAYLEEEVKERLADVGVTNAKVYVMQKSYYSTLNGKEALADLLKEQN